jgi:hypothetical protein
MHDEDLAVEHVAQRQTVEELFEGIVGLVVVLVERFPLEATTISSSLYP